MHLPGFSRHLQGLHTLNAEAPACSLLVRFLQYLQVHAPEASTGGQDSANFKEVCSEECVDSEVHQPLTHSAADCESISLSVGTEGCMCRHRKGNAKEHGMCPGQARQQVPSSGRSSSSGCKKPPKEAAVEALRSDAKLCQDGPLASLRGKRMHLPQWNHSFPSSKVQQDPEYPDRIASFTSQSL